MVKTDDKTGCITSLVCRLYRVPLDEVLVDAKHGAHTHFELVTVTLTDDRGNTGTGYTYTGGKGGHAIRAMINHDLAPFVLKHNPRADRANLRAELWTFNEAMQWHIHYVGRGGIASFAVSAIDIALWDLALKTFGVGLSQAVGACNASCLAYAGGIDLNFPLPKLLDSVRAYLDKGFEAVKIKVGQPALEEDIARIAAVRALIGPDAAFMIDANYALDFDQAVAMGLAVKPFHITWFEEPMNPDAYADYGRLAQRVDVPLAMGENLHTVYEFETAFASAALSYIQPDASNCGGISGWLQVAERAIARGIPVCSHGMQELHVSLVSGVAGQGWLEVHAFPIDRYTHRPLEIRNGRATVPQTPGTGVAFHAEKLAHFEVQ